jgi:hypothetical protein
MHSFLALAGPLLSCYFLLRLFRPAGTSEKIIVFFCLFVAHVAALGYVLSFMNRLSDIRYWSVLGLGTALVSAAVFSWSRNARKTVLPKLGSPCSTSVVASIKNWYTHELSRFERLLLTPLMLTSLLLGALNLILIVFTAPHNGDSMTYHLARVAYYLQHGNLNYFDANFWAQVVQPKNSSLWLLYTYLISGRNENATQLVQFISYWVAVCSVYAISRVAGSGRTQSVFAATIGALLTEWLMEATTTQNDMILTALFGAITYSLLAFRRERKSRYLVLATMGLGLSIGTKASALLSLSSIGLVASYALFTTRPRSLLRDSAILSVSALVAIIVFALPSGYVENYVRFGHPIGPKQVRTEHSFETEPFGQIVRSGTKNAIRFGFDFLSLDGLPALGIVQKAQAMLRILPEKVMSRLGVDLETSEATRMPFRYSKTPTAHEDTSEWGVLGFGLVWVAVFLSILGMVKSPEVRVLSIAAVLFFLCQAYAGPYDPWRGRYFTACAVFAVPAVGTLLQTRSSLGRAYLLLMTMAGCLSAVSAVVLSDNSPLMSLHGRTSSITSVFKLDRIGQLVRSDTSYYEAIKRFESLVPDDATVAVCLRESQYEYPLFGRHLTRTLIPINSFDRGLQPLPPTADYLIYNPEPFPYASLDDIYLGTDLYLRRLTHGTRACP